MRKSWNSSSRSLWRISNNWVTLVHTISQVCGRFLICTSAHRLKELCKDCHDVFARFLRYTQGLKFQDFYHPAACSCPLLHSFNREISAAQHLSEWC